MPRGPYAGPMECDLEPNPDDVWAFHRHWFRHCKQGKIQIGWMDPATGGLTHFQEYALSDTEIVEDVVAINSVPGQSVYIRASTVLVNTPGRAATDTEFCQAPGPWADQDTPEQLAHAKSVKSTIRPTALVQTGTAPHPRWQSFFLLDEPLTDPTLVRDLNRRILLLYGGDSSVVNPTRLMRLPGTIAWPWKAGRVPELTRLVLPARRSSDYALSTLTSDLPKVEATDASNSEAQTGAADGPLSGPGPARC